MANDDSGCASAIIVFVLLILGVAWGAYSYADQLGWISHDVESTITIDANWIPGEVKSCVSYPLTGEAAKELKSTAGDVTTYISCDSGPEHRVSARFVGRVEQPQIDAAYWRCFRRTALFECFQTGIEPRRVTEPTATPTSLGNCSNGETRPFPEGNGTLVCKDGRWTLTAGATRQIGNKTFRWDGIA